MFNNKFNPSRSARSAARSELGMTLLEIMIVLAIIAAVMGLLVGPRVIRMFQGSKVQTTSLMIKQIANQAYSEWSMATGKSCPKDLSELSKYRDSKSIKDAWGNKLMMQCGENAPEGVIGIAVSSKGPDGKQGTADDIKSWEEE